ncbi:hypothetical protein RHMOL_Rhmol12G0112100 [Rhododendron molle]|uniref:Uncharacterized protein n=1 Tax=Rhododendron molle TaxID=49168 RepID=A0ACC0LI27_RHOML|nr:hypothetical protein RHMOL_Rhmol12G0112100 [Rhododendron molle]
MAPLLRSFVGVLLEFVHCLPSSFLSAIGEVSKWMRIGLEFWLASPVAEAPPPSKSLSPLAHGTIVEIICRLSTGIVHCLPTSYLFTIGKEVNKLYWKNQLSCLKDQDWARILARLARRRGTSFLKATVSTSPWHHCGDRLQAFCWNCQPPPCLLPFYNRIRIGLEFWLVSLVAEAPPSSKPLFPLAHGTIVEIICRLSAGIVHRLPASYLSSIGKEVNKLYWKNQLSGLKDEEWARILARLARRRGTSSLEALFPLAQGTIVEIICRLSAGIVRSLPASSLSAIGKVSKLYSSVFR